MADRQASKNVSVNVPMGAIGLALALGVAAAAYALIGRDNTEESSSGVSMPGKGVRRKLGLMTLVAIIENDATRKVLVTLLRSMARRS